MAFGQGGGAGASQNAGIADNIFGDTGQTGDITTPPITITQAADKTTAEATRDTYFGNNPGNLTFYDNNAQLGIYLYYTLSGSTVTTFQTRVSSAWVDSTTTVGVQGEPGDDAPSQWFNNETERNDFYDANLSLLQTGLIVAVNNENGTYSVFEWTGADSPGSQDTELWVGTGETFPAGSVVLGFDGSTISSGGQVMNYITAEGDQNYMLGVRVETTGTEIPFYWDLGAEQNTVISSTNDTDLASPATITFTVTNNRYTCNYIVIPHQSGDVRVETYIGTDDTGPNLTNFIFTFVGGDIGNSTSIPLPNKYLATNGTNIFIRFTGAGLRGELATSDPVLSITEQVGFLREYFIQNEPTLNVDSDSASVGEARINFNEEAGGLKAAFFYDEGADFFCLDLQQINMDFRSNIADTTALIRWITSGTDGATVPFHFGVDDPEGKVTADRGAFYFQAATVDNQSTLHVKESNPGGDTGWLDLGFGNISGPGASVDNALATWNGVSANSLNSVSEITAQADATNVEMFFITPSVSGRSVISFFDNAIDLKSELQYLQSTDTTQLSFDSTAFEINGDINASSFRFSGGDVSFEFASTSINKKLTVDFSNLPHTSPILNLITGGANGADIDIFIGDENPNSIVSAPPGAIYKRRDGTNSTIYVHADTVTSNVNWINLIAAGAGDVSGPGVTVATNSVSVFSDTTGFNIASVDQIVAQRIGSQTRLELLTEAAGTAQLRFAESVGGSGAFIDYNDSSGQTQFINPTGRMVFATSLTTSDIVFEAGSTSSLIIENAGDNTNAPLQLSVSGIGGATVQIFASLVNPNGVITANQGDWCYVATGVDGTSAPWIKETGTGNTGWQNILSTSTNHIVGPNTSTVGSLPTFDVTTGDSVQDNPLLRYVSSASSSSLTIQEAATGTADLFFAGTGGSPIGLIQSLGANFQIEALSVGGVLNLSGLGGVSIESFSGDVILEDGVFISRSGNNLDVRMFPLGAAGSAIFQIEDSTNTDRIILSYNDNTDTALFNLHENIQASVDGNQTLLNIKADNVLDTASINFLAPLDIVQLAIQTNVNTQTNSITSSNYPLSILAGGNLTLETGGSNYTRILSVSGGNTVQMLQLDNNGTGGAEVNFYTSLVNPNGVVTGNQGDYCFVATGVDGTSALWIKETGAATNTGWQNLHSVTSGIAGPSTSTVGSLPTFDVADGSSVQDNPLLTYTSTASTSTLSLQEAATGSADFFFNGGGGSGIGLIQTLGSTFELTSINSNNLTLSSANDLTISSLFGATTMTSGGGTLRVQTTGAHAAIFEASGSGTVDLNANAGFISLINNHGELVLGSVATSITTATGVNFNVDATANGNVNITAEDTITLQTQDTSAVVATIGSGGDTFPIARYTTNGTGGGVFDLHVGDSTPQGRVSGANTLFFQTGAASSGNARIHYQDTDATVTNWNVLTSIGSGDTQPAGSFMHFPGTDLAQGTPTGRMRYFETGANTDIEMDSGANGAAAFRIKDELSNDRFTFIYNDSVPQATISTVGPVPLNIFASGNLDINATGTAEISSAQSMTIESTGVGANITVNANDDMTFFSNGEMDFSCGGLYTSNAFTRFDYICGQDGDSPIFNWSNNNIQFNWFAYFQTPVGNVTGESGDVLVRNEGADSNVYIHKNNTPNNTDWRAMDAPAIQTWGDSSIASTTATRYLTPGYDSGTAPTNAVAYRVPRDGVMQNMYINCRTAGGNGNNVVYTVRVNSISSGLAVTLASNVISGSNLSTRVNVTQGDTIDIEVTKAASIGTSPEDVMASLEIV
jgi:hypothetical protein